MTLLERELRLLIKRYGRARVFQTLAGIGRKNPPTVGAAAVQNSGRSAVGSENRRRAASGANHVVQSGDTSAPGTRGLRETLVHAFENREFLPQLRDTREFLHRYGVPAVRFRSRRAAFPAVRKALSERTEAELALIDEERRDRRGPMTIISDHLLGP